MYLRSLYLKNLRCFRRAELTLQYPGRKAAPGEPPVPKLDNVNLLLGGNGSGKTTILKTIAMSLISPVLPHAGFRPYALVRRVYAGGPGRRPENAATEAKVLLTAQDFPGHAPAGRTAKERLGVTIGREEDNDYIVRATTPSRTWRAFFKDDSPAFLVLGYSATRRIAPTEENISARVKSTHLRYRRVQGLFEEGASLVPLAWWLPGYKNPGRRKQVINLLDRLIGDFYQFEGELQNGEFLFRRGDALVPLGALSDGFRAYIGWVSDMLYHICMGCPSRKKLAENAGVVLVDEIDLHLHPEWQRTVIPTLARTFPKIQFIFTSHSPLVTGSLEWPNIHVMRDDGPVQLPDEPVHGLSADQVLLSPYFDVESTRADEKVKTLRALEARAKQGDDEAALQFLHQMTVGLEADRYGHAPRPAAARRASRRSPRA